MAGNVKGIIVEIGGDTSALQKSLNKVNTATSSLTKELNSVNRLLKVDPKSTEMLAQKQELLNQKIDSTSDKLNQLKQIQSEYISQGKDLNTENYRALTREIEKTSQELKKLKTEGKLTFGEIAQFVTNAGDKISKFSNNISNLGNKLTVGVSTPLIAAGVSALSYSSDIEQLQTSFEVMTGSADEALKTINDLKELGASTPYELKGLASTAQLLMQYGFTASDAVNATRMLGDISQGSADKMSRIAAAYGQMSSAGKVQLEDVKQMIEAGFNPLLEISNSTGESMTSLYQRISDGTVSIDEITESIKRATSEGGQFYQSSEKQSKTLAGRISTLKDETAELGAEFVEGLLPVAKDMVKKATDLINKFDDLTDEEKKNVVQAGLLLVALGPTVKLFGTLTNGIGKTVKAVGTFTDALNVMKTGIKSSNQAANTLSSVITTLTNPTTLAVTTIVTTLTVALAAAKKAQDEIKKSAETMSNASSDYITGISNANSHLDEFNSTLFATTTEQQELEENMQEIQNGITTICKTASDERRDYTQEEITQLDEYFEKLRELNQRELEIQSEISTAITQQAVTNAETFQGTLEEYKIQSQEWLNTAIEQKNSTLDIIEQQSTEELALLNQRYGDQANLQNENYAKEYNQLMTQKQEKIDAANDEVSKVAEAYSNGYTERLLQNEDFKTKLETLNSKVEAEKQRHFEQINWIEQNLVAGTVKYNSAASTEEMMHNATMQSLYDELYKNMSDSEADQLGVLMGMAMNTEIYGGQMSNETEKVVNSILESYQEIPEGTKGIMSNAMSPMLEAMQNAEPSLFAKATGIANGILSRLRTAFDIHSPSRKTRKIFNQVMQGGLLGFDDEKNNLLSQVDSLSKDISNKFAAIEPINMKNIQTEIEARTRAKVDLDKVKFNTDFSVDKMKDAFKSVIKEMNWVIVVDKEKFGELATDSVNKNFGGAF